MKKTKNTSISSNYDFYIKSKEKGRYRGQWIAIADRKILAHGKDAEKVYRFASKKTTNQISLAKVPKAQTIILQVKL